MTNPNEHLFRFCPACGCESLEPDSEKSFACQSCQFKFYLNTAAAGIALIFKNSKEVLVTRRKHDPAKGTLDLPGGFAEPGEGIEKCLVREIKEELNLDIIELSYFCSFPNTYLYRDVTYTVLDTAFMCRVTDFSQIHAADDVSEFLFLDPNQIDVSRFGLDSPKKVIQTFQNKLLKSDNYA